MNSCSMNPERDIMFERMNLQTGCVYGIIGGNSVERTDAARCALKNLLAEAVRVNTPPKTVTWISENIKKTTWVPKWSTSKKKKVDDPDINKIISSGSAVSDKAMHTWSGEDIARFRLNEAMSKEHDILVIDNVLELVEYPFFVKFCEWLRTHAKEKSGFVCIVLSRNLEFMKLLCDEAVWIDNGTVCLQGVFADVLNAYKNKHYPKEAAIKASETKLYVDLSGYAVPMYNADQKWFCKKPYDCIAEYRIGENVAKITRRTLDNGDVFLFFDVQAKATFDVELKLDKILRKRGNDSLYQRPAFDNRYGENKVTGWNGYYDLKSGSAVATRIYYYNIQTAVYEDETQSELLHLVEESNEIGFAEKESQLIIHFEPKSERAAFTLLLSQKKLFAGVENLARFEEYHYKGVFNNNVWCSFFWLPSGTYTKLPYSIEPFTREGYGFSLHHSSRKDLFPYVQQTGERFYEDVINNAILQTYLYQKQENGVFYTPFTSTWLKKSSGITAPYIDTRLNETFSHLLSDFLPYSAFSEEILPLKNYVDFLIDHAEKNIQVYRAGEQGIFFPDYFQTMRNSNRTHASLNHQLGTASLFYEAYCEYRDTRYKEYFFNILSYVAATEKSWICPENGDLYYGVKQNGNELVYYDKDYVYVTLLDLLLTQKKHVTLTGTKMGCLDRLIRVKLDYLKTTEYDPFSENPHFAPGERLDSHSLIRSLYNELY